MFCRGRLKALVNVFTDDYNHYKQQNGKCQEDVDFPVLQPVFLAKHARGHIEFRHLLETNVWNVSLDESIWPYIFYKVLRVPL
jgi:hypothetical protein